MLSDCEESNTGYVAKCSHYKQLTVKETEKSDGHVSVGCYILSALLLKLSEFGRTILKPDAGTTSS